MTEILNTLKTDLARLSCAKIVEKYTEIDRYESYVEKSYTLVGSKNTFLLKNKDSSSYITLVFNIQNRDTIAKEDLRSENTFQILEKDIHLSLTNELGNQQLIDGNYLNNFLKKWSTFYTDSLKKEYKDLLAPGDVLSIKITIFNGLEEGNIFNLLCVGLKKSLEQVSLEIEKVELKLKDYLELDLLPYYIYGVISLNKKEIFLILNPTTESLESSLDIIGRVSAFFFKKDKKNNLNEFNLNITKNVVLEEEKNLVEEILKKMSSLLA